MRSDCWTRTAWAITSTGCIGRGVGAVWDATRCRGSGAGDLSQCAQAPSVASSRRRSRLPPPRSENTYANCRRAQRADRRQVSCDGDNPAHHESEFSSREIMRAIASAPTPFRDAVIAIDVLGLSYREAARSLRAPEATITTRPAPRPTTQRTQAVGLSQEESLRPRCLTQQPTIDREHVSQRRA